MSNKGIKQRIICGSASCGWGPLDPEIDKKLRELFGRDLIRLSYDGQTACVYDTRGWHHKFHEKYAQNAPAANYLGVSHPFYATKIVVAEMNTAAVGETGEKDSSPRA